MPETEINNNLTAASMVERKNTRNVLSMGFTLSLGYAYTLVDSLKRKQITLQHSVKHCSQWKQSQYQLAIAHIPLEFHNKRLGFSWFTGTAMLLN